MSKAAKMKKWRYKQAAVGIICALCDEPISKGGDKGKGALTADHIIPKALGGTYANDNLQPAHAKCNHKRQTMLVSHFKDLSSQQAIVKRAIEIIEMHDHPVKSKFLGFFKALTPKEGN